MMSMISRVSSPASLIQKPAVLIQKPSAYPHRPAVKFGDYAFAYNDPQRPVYIDWTSNASKQADQLKASVDHLAAVVEQGFRALIETLKPVNPPHKDM